MPEITIKIIVFIIMLAVFVGAYRTKSLDCVKDSYERFIFRVSYAMMLARGVLFVAVDLLELWQK